MSSFTPLPNQTKSSKSSTFKKILIYAFMLILAWLVMTIIVIPLESSDRLPEKSQELIEGARGYAAVVREVRPTLLEAVSGLDMAGIHYVVFQNSAGSQLSFGNIRIDYTLSGEFIHLSMEGGTP